MEDEWFFYFCIVALAILIPAIIIGIWYHINHGKFKPNFEEFSDGSVRMVFFNISEHYSRQMNRFNAEYKVGQEVVWQGRRFVIEEIKPQNLATQWGLRHAIVAYLKEMG